MKKMRTMIVGAALAVLATAAQAASLTPAQVDGLAIGCLFNPGCTNVVEETSSPFTLPGTVGTGFLHTRVILGESNSPAAKHFGYEYRLDLSGVTLDPAVTPCVTNVLQCVTNRVEVNLTNVVVCRTNAVGVTNVVNCVTNTIPGTNMVLCVTNSFPGTTNVQCYTNATGAVTCFTNSFPATNYVLCFTNRVPGVTNVTCQTNRLTGSNVVTCTTNSPHYFTNIVTCTTNSIPCPESTSCIQKLSIQFGPAVALDFDTNTPLRELVYVVSTNGLGSSAPSQITWDDGKLVLRFSPPLCPGDSSLTVGLVSRGAPRDVPAKLKLTTGDSVLALTRAPRVVRSIDCDFSDLSREIRAVKTRDILGANNTVREAHRTALLGLVQAATDAAAAGDAGDVMAALGAILERTDGGRNDWLTSNAARKVNKAMAEVTECVVDGQDHHDGDNDDDDDDDDDDDHGHHHSR